MKHPQRDKKRAGCSLVFLLTCGFLCLALLTGRVQTAFARSARFVSIQCQSRDDLHEFNDNIYLGKTLSRQILRKDVITVEDEVNAKVDFIVAKVQTVLNMYPRGIHFTLVILHDKKAVGRAYNQAYHKKVNYKAYYSLSRKTVYISADDASLRVLSHEIGHMVVDHFFKVRPPYNIHELMAQFAEKHVGD